MVTDLAQLTAAERAELLAQLLSQVYLGTLSYGQLLATLRKRLLGMSQQQYADRVGISRRTLSDIERDVATPSFAVIKKLYRPLGLQAGLVPVHSETLKRAVEKL
ncbi:helix-turn-helix transcriptional regulator [Ferrimonas senticii]|uniref:helix-turn-helix transcriptional regulator n=1 Tax=Ferrimonas senticii TaxID=394566 RepID=UPI0004118C50|nr:helix-turn-helix transcriptional regulator [Ferrimonas senticii]